MIHGMLKGWPWQSDFLSGLQGQPFVLRDRDLLHFLHFLQ